MSDDAPKKFTTSDYTVLNEHFNQALARDNEIVRARRAKTFWVNAQSIALILFFLGVAAMFIGKAIQLSKGERIVEQIVERNNTQQDSYTEDNQQEKVVIDGQEINIQKSVTHFREAQVNYKAADYWVMTRHNYHDPRDSRPFEQSCYINKSSMIIDISQKKGEGAVTRLKPDIDYLGMINLTLSDVNYFYKFCKYI